MFQHNIGRPHWHLVVQQSKHQVLAALIWLKNTGPDILKSVKDTNHKGVFCSKNTKNRGEDTVNEVYSKVTFLFSGEKGSFVHGSIIDKVFTGKIRTARGTTYWVEHADKYFDDPKFHSVIYAEHDVNDDPHR